MFRVNTQISIYPIISIILFLVNSSGDTSHRKSDSKFGNDKGMLEGKIDFGVFKKSSGGISLPVNQDLPISRKNKLSTVIRNYKVRFLKRVIYYVCQL